MGKSSVINRILNRKNFARVGATPGKTTQINYFRIDDKIYFTDLPGYGYSKTSKEERERYSKLIEEYFAVDQDGDGVVTTSEGAIVDIRATAIVWCAGRNGKLDDYAKYGRSDDVYSWQKSQEQK